MTKTVINIFMDYEKEEKWLNEMSSKGYHLIKYSFVKYVFEVNPDVVYHYKLQYLKESPKSASNTDYLKLLEDQGIEMVDSSMNCVYLRRNQSLGDLDLFTDYASVILHYKGVMKPLIALGIVNLGFGLIYLGSWLTGDTCLGIGMLNTTIGLLLLFQASRIYRKIRKLAKEQQISEY